MKYLFYSILSFLLFSCTPEGPLVQYATDDFQLGLDDEGYLTAFKDPKSGTDYLAKDTLAPLLVLRKAGQLMMPTGLRHEGNVLSLQFEEGITATVEVKQETTHVTFEVKAVTPMKGVEMVIWGPYPTTIDSLIGETIGVVRGETYSLGLQSLNPKTLGGYPWHDNDCMPQLDIFETGDYSDLSEKGKRYVLYRVEAAKPTAYGSSLQAYCRNRTEERVTKNWGHDHYTIPVYEDGGVVGSKIALFGCEVGKTLDRLGEIEIAEGLPHPMVDGQWGKQARSAAAAYMIMGFGEKDIAKAIAYTQQAGLKYLYHPGPFENWGHFELNAQFPSGWDGLKACSQAAKAEGIYTGVHTLSNFITTNDPYVTPIPDPRLATVGSGTLTSLLPADSKEIAVDSPTFFDQYDNNHLKTVRIGEELIRYGGVSEGKPWKLLDCERGAWGTKATVHEVGELAHKLADHGYKVFLTNPELTVEMATQLSKLYNYCGLQQISFDGLEGNRSTGMGNYGEVLFTDTWYQHLDESVKNHFIADASRTSHYFWHLYTRMNWGEPWYAGFRESQTEYRMKNQAYFERNLMPNMLGWFSMHKNTPIEDIEWMLARSAAFNAGYGFVSDYEVLEENGATDEILGLIGMWEEARMADAFSAEQRERMKDIHREFSLERVGEGQWNLQEVHSFKFAHDKKVRQPGEPLYSTFNFENPASKRAMHLILTAIDADIQAITLELDHHRKLALPLSLKAGESLKYTGGPTAIHYDANWHPLREIPISEEDWQLANGKHSLEVDCAFAQAKEGAKLKVEVRVLGDGEVVGRED